jgi:hypothetical protein
VSCRPVTKAQQEELDALAEKGGGVLRPEAVVEFARHQKTALHRRFTWDDTKAGHAFRLIEARSTIRVYVTVVESSKVPFRAFVSLSRDQKEDGGGYRRTSDVMGREDLRKELLQMALDDLRRFEERYRRLTELEVVFAAIRRVSKARRTKAA